MNKKKIAKIKVKNISVLPVSFYQTWVITGGAYMFAVACPCCGGNSCPVGLGMGALIGGSFAGVTHGFGILRKVVENKKNKLEK